MAKGHSKMHRLKPAPATSHSQIWLLYTLHHFIHWFPSHIRATSKAGFILGGRQNLGQIWVKPFAGYAPIVRRLDSDSSWGFQITNLKNFVPWSGAAYPNLSQRSNKKWSGPADLRTKTMDQCNDAMRHSWPLLHLLEIETAITKHQSIKSGPMTTLVQ